MRTWAHSSTDRARSIHCPLRGLSSQQALLSLFAAEYLVGRLCSATRLPVGEGDRYPPAEEGGGAHRGM